MHIRGLINQPKLQEALRETVDEQMQHLRDYIVNTKMPGVGIGTVSGGLAASVKPLNTIIVGSKIFGGVKAGGPNARQAAAFEYGYPNPLEIRPKNRKALAFMPESPRGPVDSRGMVRNFVVRPPIPRKPFLHAGFMDQRSEIIAAIRKTINEVTE